MVGPSVRGSHLLDWMGVRKLPASIENLCARTIKAHHVVPALHGGQAVGDNSVATAELDRDRAVVILLCCDVVEGVGAEAVWFEIAVGVVETDRPEAIDGYILDVDLVDRRPVVLGRRDVGKWRPYRG